MRGKNKETPCCHIGIDLLGSDIAPSVLLDAILAYSQNLKSSAHLTLFGTADLFSGKRAPVNNILFHPVNEIITMEDAPLTAIRKKKGSSLCLGIQMLKKGLLQAFISAGNTGALMSYAKIELPSLPRVQRPALMTLLPAGQKEVAVLDVGANTSYQANHLVQFAAIGVAYQKSRGIEKPKVGLLNIGSEAKKGTPELRLAYNKLFNSSKKKNSSFIFAGNIEGRDVFSGSVDVLVTDGFTGNVFLKTAEGIAGVILEELQALSLDSCPHDVKTSLTKMQHYLYYPRYPGAILCGIDALVIKCHGTSSPESLLSSIPTALRLIEHQFLKQVKKELR